MKRYFKILPIIVSLSLSNAHAVNPVFCWLMDLQGCPGVEVEQGRARGTSNTGSKGIGATGAKSQKVETRTIITIPDHKMRSILRFFGLGGSRINVSYEDSQQEGCFSDEDHLKALQNPLLQSASISECFQALENDLAELPVGLNLQIIQCQEVFCHKTFIEKFTLFLRDNPRYQIRNSEQFLGCKTNSFDI